jgi:hypothetical protein
MHATIDGPMRIAPHPIASLAGIAELARPVLFVAYAAVLATACAKEPEKAAKPDPKAVTPAEPSACEVLKGTWRVEGFLGENPAASASAAQLNAGLDEQAQSVRIAYTGTRVKMWSPGSLMISNAYEVKEAGPKRCLFEVKGERTLVELVDANHVLMERGAANVGAKMRMERTHDEAPAVGGQ